MSIVEIVDSLKRRTPWQVGQKILAEHNLPRGRGWDNTLGKISPLAADFDDQTDDLSLALKEHILCGEKVSSFYQLTDDETSALRAASAALQVDSNPFSDCFPLMLPEDQLGDAPRTPVLTAIEATGDGVALVYSSVRTVTIREPISLDDIPEEAQEAFDDFDEIIGIKTEHFQAYDLLWIPHAGNRVEIRSDYPNGTPIELALAARRRLEVIGNTLTQQPTLHSPINLFPLINQMYGDKNEGKVVELGFGTTTASLKHEKMRRRKQDLRNEEYHKGGKAALNTPIEPFKVSILWERKVNGQNFSTPELNIFSSALAAGNPDPAIDRVIIRRCHGLADYEFVLSRIDHHLSSP